MVDDDHKQFLFVLIFKKINEMEYYFCGEIEKLEILVINFFSGTLFSVYERKYFPILFCIHFFVDLGKDLIFSYDAIND